ncbi:MAG TPA: PAS domain-containing protein [Gaiellaceae bacterium]|jgi:PAS domain S-box-containing protein|nr:PAS domain-containing protein [Gaiellaceae bacterium]
MSEATRIAQLALLGEAADCLEQVAMFVWDDDRNYVAANDAACELVGRTRDEVLQMKVGDMTADRAAELFEQVQHGVLHTGTHVIEHPGGPVELEWMTCRTRIAGLPYMVSVCWRKEHA